MDAYDVKSYTDDELLNILELTKPTDAELEGRIVQLMQKHMYMKSDSGKKLFLFFKSMYYHFFDVDPDNLANQQNAPTNPQNNAANPPQNAPQNAPAKSVDTFNKSYSKGNINPLLKETYRRTISIDSQYREAEYTIATDFTINFSETLKDVLSLKLYAIQIPITWYTISNNYGSNFFFFKPRYDTSNNTLGIYNPNHEYKVIIPPGNYTSESLVAMVSATLKNLSSVYTDVSFGNTDISYNKNQVKSTLTMDIQKVYNEFDYFLDCSGVQQMLGFHDTSFGPTQIFYNPKTNNSHDIVTEKSQGSSIKFIKYKPTTTLPFFDDVSSNSLFETFIDLPRDVSYNAVEWVPIIQKLLDENEHVKGSTISLVDEGTTWKWDIKPNRYHVLPEYGTKWVIQVEDNGFSRYFFNNTYNESSTKTYSVATSVATNKYDLKGASIIFRPNYHENGGVYIDPKVFPEYKSANDITIKIDDNSYNTVELIDHLNTKLAANPLTTGSKIKYDIDVSGGMTNLTIQYTIHKIYTTKDYSLVWYDILSFSRCSTTASSYKNATKDTTLGYILGFKTLSEYEMIRTNAVANTQIGSFSPTYFLNIDTGFPTGSVYSYTETDVRTVVQLTGDSVVSVYLYNYFMLILDDFNQNHLNDGLVTLAQRDTSVTLPSYATRAQSRTCDPASQKESSGLAKTSGLTQNQIYSVEMILAAQNKTKSVFNEGLYIKDMFALMPVRTSGMDAGSIYVELGGTLQQQDRMYFGPVNIRRLAIKLVNDKGDVVDLNGGNWSFQLICEQLYQS